MGQGEINIVVIDVEGNNPVQLTRNQGDNEAPSWSPDGKKLAFVASEPKEKTPYPLPYAPEIYEEDLTYRRGYVTDLQKEMPDRIQVGGCFYTVRWSPDGNGGAAKTSPIS